jgi:hypothetical protein
MRDVVDQVITSNRAASGFKTQQQAESGGGGGGGGGMTSGSPTIARTNSLGGRRMPAGVNETISAGPSASLRLRLIHFIHWLVCLPVSVYLSVCLAGCLWLANALLPSYCLFSLERDGCTADQFTCAQFARTLCSVVSTSTSTRTRRRLAVARAPRLRLYHSLLYRYGM